MNLNLAQTQPRRYWHVLMLVSLLLFLPLAQAIHLDGHDLQLADIHCQICHSSIDIDTDTPKAKATIVVNNATEYLVHIRQSSYQFTHATHSAIRAPPFNS